jgi:hypothetical protein
MTITAIEDPDLWVVCDQRPATTPIGVCVLCMITPPVLRRLRKTSRNRG